MSLGKFLSIVDGEIHKQYRLEKWKDNNPKKEQNKEEHKPLKFYYLKNQFRRKVEIPIKYINFRSLFDYNLKSFIIILLLAR